MRFGPNYRKSIDEVLNQSQRSVCAGHSQTLGKPRRKWSKDDAKPESIKRYHDITLFSSVHSLCQSLISRQPGFNMAPIVVLFSPAGSQPLPGCARS
jgi:hypothetical protein